MNENEMDGKSGSDTAIIDAEKRTETWFVGADNNSLAGVVVPRVNGRFAPGVSGNPAGRGTKKKETAVLDAIKQAIDPSEVAHLFQESLDLARRSNSWRGIFATLELYLAYTVGKPAQTIKIGSTREDLISILQGDSRPLLGDGGEKGEQA